MATGTMAGGAAVGEEERGAEGAAGNVALSSSPLVVPLSDVGSHTESPVVQRKPRSYVPRAAPSRPWGSKLGVPVLPPAPPAKDKPAGLCANCGATKTPMWRTLPTDRQVRVCNACGIRVRSLRAAGAVLSEQVHVPPPTKKVSAPPPRPELQRVHRRPPSPAAMERPAKKRARLCAPCSATETSKWRILPTGRQGMLCNSCGIRLGAPGAVLPAEHQPAPQEIQPASDPESPPGVIVIVIDDD